ncbi:MAG: SURF1 family protein [Gammaproteobacteria bacterium]|nr:SURF1 family protein [Gammaproteobacteria bacterium]
MQIRLFNQDFVLRWWLIVVTLAAFCLLIKLSLWQWQRGEEKQQHLTQIQNWQQLGAPSFVELSRYTEAALDGAPLSGTANWQSPIVWLVDNQIWQGKAGYDVLIPVRVLTEPTMRSEPSTQLLLVNLGWVAALDSRQQLPQIKIPTQIDLQGVLRTKLGAFRLGNNLEETGTWPMRVQTIDVPSLATTVSQPLFHGVFYQEKSPFRYHYQAVVLPPEKHRAYALQWLLLAIAVVMVAMAASYQKEP